MSVTTSRPSQVSGTAAQPVLRPQSFGELMQFAKMAAASSMVPKDYLGKPENIMLAVQMGSELGLSPMQAIQNIAVVNGRPTVWGDAMPGLIKASGTCKDIIERIEGEGDAMAAVCIAQRHGAEPVIVRFSVADAKKANLWGKPGPWQQYPKRMLQMRARGFALRDAFPDVLRGLISSEEAADIPEAAPFTGPTIVVAAEPAPEPSPEPPKRSVRELLRDKLAVCDSADDVAECLLIPAVAKIMRDGPDEQRTVLTAMINEAYERFAPPPAAEDTEEAA